MNLEQEIIEWAKVRGIFDQSNPARQLDKTREEVEEIGVGINSNDLDEIRDGIGDSIVTLVLLAKMHDLTVDECVQAAWNEIKDRTGKMIDGQFVKDAATGARSVC